jgi:hypothetical protein
VNPTIRILGLEDAAVLDRVAPGVFDNAVDPRWAAEFLADSRHHLAVAYLPRKNPHRRSDVRERMMPLIALRRPPCDGAVVVELLLVMLVRQKCIRDPTSGYYRSSHFS